ncbi:transglutaminase family protein [Sphingomonas gilva]|uniref:Transglutaminase family protein n=1 Tax=Sphingomonas gilva TaxID=2305907 RepID=A0A396RR82_9SPHN|nr:transglutaminase family protein [Sphingomonas gilva]RHW19167.1 transglutaminase family protein [Sphingomonas gilva]
MRLSIDHLTRYRFSQPQARIVQLLRLTPSDTDDQTIVSWRIDVDCDARLREGRDGFGNRTTMLYIDGPITGIEIAVAGEVLTGEVDGVVKGTLEPLPPALFARSTDLTRADAAIAAFAAAARGAPRAQLESLNTAFAKRFALSHARPDHGLTAAEAFARETATPRDMAQMFVAAARSLGLPARYVSGHCLTCEREAERPTTHGWAEAHVEGEGWIGFDPSFARPIDQTYVRVACGLDAAQAAPVAGSRLGAGREWLDVDVQVERMNGGEQ